MPKKKKEMPKKDSCHCGCEEEGCYESSEHNCRGGHINYNKNFHNTCKQGGGIYGLGFIGAAIFFVSQASTFWQGALGLLKAIIWPVFMVYELFKFLIK